MAQLAVPALAALILAILALSQQTEAVQDAVAEHRAIRLGGRRQILASEGQLPPSGAPQPQPQPTPQPRPQNSSNVTQQAPTPIPAKTVPLASPPKPSVSPLRHPAPAQPSVSPQHPAPAPAQPSPSPSPAARSPPPSSPKPRGGEVVDPVGGGNCPDAPNILNQTNFYRVRHQAPPLVWSPTLAAASAAYAQKLADGNCTMKHAGSKAYGESLMMVQGLPRTDNSCTIAARSWYGEVLAYDFSADRPFYDNWARGIGHFSQLVWRGSSSMGCGVGLANVTMQLGGGRTLPGGCKIIVCRYKAPGNVATDMHFLKNVLRNTSAAVV